MKSVCIRDPEETLELLLYYESGRRGAVEFDNQGLKPFGLPFWADLPLCNIYTCLAPDLLHQLHKGVFDHLLEWCLTVANNDAEVDRRMSALPSHPSLRHFTSGFTNLKQTTGTEHRHIQKVILGVLAGLVPDDVLNAMRAIVDFIYYSQFDTHTSHTLLLLDDALSSWHEYKDVFVRLRIRHELFFRINKIHSMEHYSDLIRQLGAADGFNTELPERLHIEYAKLAYKATNRKQYLRQMCTYLSRCEAIYRFDDYLDWAMSPEGIAFDSTPAAHTAKSVDRMSVGIPPTYIPLPRSAVLRLQFSLSHTSIDIVPEVLCEELWNPNGPWLGWPVQ